MSPVAAADPIDPEADVPLSEEELRALEQMERALTEEDPKFVSTLRGTTARRSARRRAILAGVVFVVGIAVLMAGVTTKLWAVGVVGFVIMLGSATLGLNAVRQGGPAEPTGPRPASRGGFSVVDGGRAGRPRRSGRGPSRGSTRSSGSFMERVEERWRRRRESGGF